MISTEKGLEKTMGKHSIVTTFQKLLEKYQQQWRYIIIGGCTTVINYVIYFLLVHFKIHYILDNILAWVGAVTFAYFANGAWVYAAESKRSWKEAMAFVCSRLFSLGLETVLLFLLVELIHVDKTVAKLVCAVLVVVVNYFTGLLVYKK